MLAAEIAEARRKSLELPASATDVECKTAEAAALRKTLHLPASATDEECKTAAVRRKTLHLPASATDEECKTAEAAALRKALHLPASATDEECKTAEANIFASVYPMRKYGPYWDTLHEAYLKPTAHHAVLST